MAYYDYDIDSEPEKAAHYSQGGCLSGFVVIPLSVISISTILFFLLSRVQPASSNTTIQNGMGGNSSTFVSPYDVYTLTQGPHGYAYGHEAIDIAAGKGAVILSPIYGIVTQLFYDGLGNPVLVIENEIYQITMLHGVYQVEVGESVNAGQAIGIESNLGNTTDMQGNSCRNRDCGYHTHLNVFDKRIGGNVNPLDLLDPR
jgi:murein DD-endopeptidase MepM/ murein hydrolase activator NlpD